METKRRCTTTIVKVVKADIVGGQKAKKDKTIFEALEGQQELQGE